MNSSPNVRSVLAALVTFGCLVVGHRAHALGQGPFIGRATDPNTISCFESGASASGNSSGNIVNDGCNGLISYTIPLATNAGNHPVRIDGSNTGGLSCFLCSTTQSGVASCVNFPGFPAGTSAQTATVNVPNNGGLYARCSVGFNSALNAINYTP